MKTQIPENNWRLKVMEKNKSNNLAVCIICGILTVFGIVACIISLINGGNGIWIFMDIVNIILCLLIGYYAVYAYRRPHGNLLRFIILIYAASYLFPVYSNAKMGRPGGSVCQAIIIGLLCYIAGRLNKWKQNTFLMIIATAIILLRAIVGYVNDGATIGVITHLVVWIDICAAYFLRYKEHKSSGLMDKETE